MSCSVGTDLPFVCFCRRIGPAFRYAHHGNREPRTIYVGTCPLLAVYASKLPANFFKGCTRPRKASCTLLAGMAHTGQAPWQREKREMVEKGSKASGPKPHHLSRPKTWWGGPQDSLRGSQAVRTVIYSARSKIPRGNRMSESVVNNTSTATRNQRHVHKNTPFAIGTKWNQARTKRKCCK